MLLYSQLISGAGKYAFYLETSCSNKNEIGGTVIAHKNFLCAMAYTLNMKSANKQFVNQATKTRRRMPIPNMACRNVQMTWAANNSTSVRTRVSVACSRSMAARTVYASLSPSRLLERKSWARRTTTLSGKCTVKTRTDRALHCIGYDRIILHEIWEPENYKAKMK